MKGVHTKSLECEYHYMSLVTNLSDTMQEDDLHILTTTHSRFNGEAAAFSNELSAQLLAQDM
jgi:hypothetical protein